MAISDKQTQWGGNRGIQERLDNIHHKQEQNQSKSSSPLVIEVPTVSYEGKGSIWLNSEVQNHDDTANLDDQQSVTLYYLGRLIKDVPEVTAVYVEELEGDRLKHWTVLPERDYDIMDKIYDIEEDALDRFPASNMSFRVTVSSDDGPSTSTQAIKILSSE